MIYNRIRSILLHLGVRFESCLVITPQTAWATWYAIHSTAKSFCAKEESCWRWIQFLENNTVPDKNRSKNTFQRFPSECLHAWIFHKLFKVLIQNGKNRPWLFQLNDITGSLQKTLANSSTSNLCNRNRMHHLLSAPHLLPMVRCNYL